MVKQEQQPDFLSRRLPRRRFLQESAVVGAAGAVTLFDLACQPQIPSVSRPISPVPPESPVGRFPTVTSTVRPVPIDTPLPTPTPVERLSLQVVSPEFTPLGLTEMRYSGEVQEVKEERPKIIQAYRDGGIGKQEYYEKMFGLTLAYFNDRMRKYTGDTYDASLFKDRVFFVNDIEFKRLLEECRPFTGNAVAFVDTIAERMFLRDSVYSQPTLGNSLFATFLHEHGHFTPKTRRYYPNTVQRWGIPGQVSNEKGFMPDTLPTDPSIRRDCGEYYFSRIEEPTTELLSQQMQVDLDGVAQPSGYDSLVRTLRANVLNLFQNDPTVIYRTHQATEREELFKEVGRRLGGPEAEALDRGGNHIIRFFPKER